jgi:hypothetical protein
MTNKSHRIDHGAFCVWQYNGPAKKARGFWHGDNPILCPMWAYALRSPRAGVQGEFFWDTSRAKGGFDSENAAVTAAQATLASRQNG